MTAHAHEKPAKRRTFIAALLSTAALAAAVPALADTTDDAYLKALEGGGIVIKDRAAAIAMGKTVCAGLDKGATFNNLVTTLMSNGLSPTEAGHVFGVSVAAYCPQHRG